MHPKVRGITLLTRIIFGSVDIRTGDEIEILLQSMIQMERDIDSYIDSLTQTRQQLNTARKQADNMQELAHLDSLTGIRNKTAYDKETGRLEEDRRNGLTVFGIAMINLNSLKFINDTYGHDRGNIAIKKLCKLICDVFAHSPVFRIGGDEFAVILRNHDFREIESLEQKFEQAMVGMTGDASLEPWEKITAALGYAMYNASKDTCVEDVFRRADQKMYDRKRKMKGMQ